MYVSLTCNNRVAPLPRDTCQIDILFLYTPDAKAVIGGITDAQFQSRLADAIADSNISMKNSNIDLELNLRHVEEVSIQTSAFHGFGRRLTTQFRLSVLDTMAPLG